MANCVQAGMPRNVTDQQKSVDTDTIGAHRCSLADLMLTIFQINSRSAVETG